MLESTTTLNVQLIGNRLVHELFDVIHEVVKPSLFQGRRCTRIEHGHVP
jgi:hypothetical protein